MSLEPVQTSNAPNAIGPYSQAIKAAGWVFCSGQVALRPTDNEFEEGDVATQAKQVLRNLQGVLEAAGTSLDRVVKTTVYLTSMNDFPVVNEIYAQFFGESKPARATVAVSELPKSAKVEIDAIAIQS